MQELSNFLTNYQTVESNGEITIILNEISEILPSMEMLKNNNDFPFQMLIDVCGVHYPDNAKPLCVIYHLLSISKNVRVRLKINIHEHEEVPSIAGIFQAACWFERETYDMFGIKFANSHDLRRILTDYDFTDFPLRKDFPLFGKDEVRYDNAKEEIVYENVNLEQKYRDFKTQSSWHMPKYNKKDE